jgi:hypothetical protein
MVFRTRTCALAAGGLAAVLCLPRVIPLTTIDMSSYDAEDAGIFMWNFWWTRHALASGHSLYWTDLLVYPHGASLALHSYPLPYCLLSLPVQWLVPGVPGLTLAFNLIVLLSFALTAAVVCILAARVSRSSAGGLVAGIIVALAPFRSLNIARLHLMATEFPAIYVLCWIAFVERPSRARAVALGLSLALCVYSEPEYAIAAALFSTLWLIYEWRLWYTRTAMGIRSGLAVAFTSCAILISPLLLAQANAIIRHEIHPVRSLEEVSEWSPALVSFFVPSRMHPVYGSILTAAGEYKSPGVDGMRSETTIPLTAWVLVIVALARAKRDRSIFWLIAGTTFLVLTLGPFLRLTGTWMTRVPLPYAVLYQVLPFLRSSRDPTRMLPMATLMLAVVAAFGVRACIAKVRSRSAASIMTALLVGAIAFESLTRSTTHATPEQLVPAFYQRIARTPGEFTVLDLGLDQLALLAQTVHGKPITAGSSSIPRAAEWDTLDVERDLRAPDSVASLSGEARSARLTADRHELIRLNCRFVVLQEASSNQSALAGELGLLPVDSIDSFLWEVPSANSSR